jgi:putative transposase
MVYPYLLSEFIITRPNQVWQVDITYLRTNHGFMYLVALIDVYSRQVMGWRLSNDLSVSACLDALEDAILRYGIPDIINSDQGAQFTSEAWVKALKAYGIMISMTGKGRCNDNAYIERLWRAFKYEGSFFYKWNSVAELKANIPNGLSGIMREGRIRLWITQHRVKYIVDLWINLAIYRQFHNINNYRILI